MSRRRIALHATLSIACLAGGVAVVGVRSTGGPRQTPYGRSLQRLERTVDEKRVFQPNPAPNLIARAYRRTVASGEARIVTNGTDDETEGSTSYRGAGVVWLSEGSAETTTTVTRAKSSTVTTRIVRNDMYIESPAGGPDWKGLSRGFGGPLNYPAENFTVPLFSLQYLSTLHTAVHPGTVVGPGIKPCRGYLTFADEHGGDRDLRTSVGICLDPAGRIAVASFRYVHQDDFSNSRERFTIQLSHFGVDDPIVDPPSVQYPFEAR